MPRTQFEADLEALGEKLEQMAESMEQALADALAVLETRNADDARRVVDGDADIDRQEREIERLCLHLLLIQQPVVAGDLRRVSGALKMVGDMERIGDQAAEIAEIARTLEEPLAGAAAAHLKEMGECAMRMVKNAMRVYASATAEGARAVTDEDEKVNVLFERVKADVVAAIKAESGEPGNLVACLMAAKYLERVGDHAKNIAQWAEYSVTGLYKGQQLS